jgi:hypothetical protein
MATDWVQFPVISGLMFSTCSARHSFALKAVEDFINQSWPHKELVIINSTGICFPMFSNVFEIPARKVGGGAKALGLEQCNGEWIADWQDDCRYDPCYLRTLARLRSKDIRVSLRSYLGRCIQEEDTFSVKNDGSEFGLVFRFVPETSKIAWLDRPELATRYYASKVSI